LKQDQNAQVAIILSAVLAFAAAASVFPAKSYHQGYDPKGHYDYVRLSVLAWFLTLLY